MNICILATSPDWGPVINFSRAFKRCTTHNIDILCAKKDSYGFYEHRNHDMLLWYKQPDYTIRALSKADVLLIFGLNSLKRFLPKNLFVSRFWKKYGVNNSEHFIKTRKIGYFSGCTYLLSNNEETNNVYSSWPIYTLFYMADLKDYIHCNIKKQVPYYPPMCPSYMGINEINKSDKEIVLCHSPGFRVSHDDKDIKGTKLIKSVFEKLISKYKNVSYDIISGTTNIQCTKRKSKSHIFVDQISPENLYTLQPPYLGGLGKSGLEAITLGSVTLTSFRNISSEPFVPTPPIINITKDNLYDKLEKLIANKDERDHIANKQKRWAEKYLSDEYVVNYILKNMDIK